MGGERGRLEGHCPFSREWSGSTMQIFIWRPWEPGEGFSCELSRRGAVCPYSCTLAYCKELGRVFWTGRRDILRFVHFCEALQSFCLLLCAFFSCLLLHFCIRIGKGGDLRVTVYEIGRVQHPSCLPSSHIDLEPPTRQWCSSSLSSTSA